jgi:hypothetical protein
VHARVKKATAFFALFGETPSGFFEGLTIFAARPGSKTRATSRPQFRAFAEREKS